MTEEKADSAPLASNTLTMEELTFEDGGELYFYRTWRLGDKEWTNCFRWDDLEGASWLPPCEDIDGLLLFCEGF